MVVVLERKEGAHRAECKSCGSKLEYHLGEVEETTKTDYSGDTDRYKFINCPVCDQKVYV